MNQRIKDLKEQALCWAVETLDPDSLNDNEWGVAIDEKFAELIIQNCTNIIANQGKFLGYVALEEKVKKHFGIDSPK